MPVTRCRHMDYVNSALLHFVLYHILLFYILLSAFLSVRESEDTALLLLKEIYDKLGVAFEQPQQ